MGAELFMRTDGQTDRHDEDDSCFSPFCKRAKKATVVKGKRVNLLVCLKQKEQFMLHVLLKLIVLRST